MYKSNFDLSGIELSWKDKKKGVKLPDSLTVELAEDIGIHIGDGSMNIYPNPYGNDYYYKCSGNPLNEKEWYDKFVTPLKEKLFNWVIKPRKLSDRTYGLQFRSKGIVLFYNKVVGLPLGRKARSIDIPGIIKNSPLKYKISCLRGIFDTDFSVTFKKKTKDIHHYPVIRASFASKSLFESLKEILRKIDFNFYSGELQKYDYRTRKTLKGYDIFISGKKQLRKWFRVIGSSNPNHSTKFNIWDKFGFCPIRTTVNQRKQILSGKLDPLSLEK